MTQDEWLERAKNIHNDKFDYSKVNYINSRTKVLIGCNIHGEFSQLANSHLQGNGCPLCARSIRTIDIDTFIKQAKEKHGDKYDYSKVKYINNSTKVCIICPKHGDFKQVASYHLYGNGCPKCNMSFLERKVMNYLNENKINFEHKKHFDWLKNKTYMELDFFLTDYNLAIECQGIQHFEVRTFGSKHDDGTMRFLEQKKRDLLKQKLCKDNKIPLYYINYDCKDVANVINSLLKNINI